MHINLDYPVNPRPRYGYGKPPHRRLYEIINRGPVFREHLAGILNYRSFLGEISLCENRAGPSAPYWVNDWFSGLDAAALYYFIRLKKPGKFVEIGSGMSTRFAGRAVLDGGLKTQIISIDPQPRSEIDCLCHSVIRRPVEELETGIFEDLQEGDILFIDNSHRVFMNSDVTVVFLDILPVLARGVLVHFHDIFLPFDYPPGWGVRYYSEQYLLAACLLSESKKFEIILANSFISNDRELMAVASALWEGPVLGRVEMTGGGSFWIEIK